MRVGVCVWVCFSFHPDWSSAGFYSAVATAAGSVQERRYYRSKIQQQEYLMEIDLRADDALRTETMKGREGRMSQMWTMDGWMEERKWWLWNEEKMGKSERLEDKGRSFNLRQWSGCEQGKRRLRP